jgi:hypothetical protein
LKLLLAMRGLYGQLASEGMVQRHVVAKERIWPEGNVVDAQQVNAVLEVLHE